jgi:hypothetical protein
VGAGCIDNFRRRGLSDDAQLRFEGPEFRYEVFHSGGALSPRCAGFGHKLPHVIRLNGGVSGINVLSLCCRRWTLVDMRGEQLIIQFPRGRPLNLMFASGAWRGSRRHRCRGRLSGSVSSRLIGLRRSGRGLNESFVRVLDINSSLNRLTMLHSLHNILRPRNVHPLSLRLFLWQPHVKRKGIPNILETSFHPPVTSTAALSLLASARRPLPWRKYHCDLSLVARARRRDGLYIHCGERTVSMEVVKCTFHTRWSGGFMENIRVVIPLFPFWWVIEGRPEWV